MFTSGRIFPGWFPDSLFCLLVKCATNSRSGLANSRSLSLTLMSSQEFQLSSALIWPGLYNVICSIECGWESHGLRFLWCIQFLKNIIYTMQPSNPTTPVPLRCIHSLVSPLPFVCILLVEVFDNLCLICQFINYGKVMTGQITVTLLLSTLCFKAFFFNCTYELNLSTFHVIKILWCSHSAQQLFYN